VPRPIGTCEFVNDADLDELVATLDAHRELCAGLPRGGAGVEMSSAVSAASPAGV
jgi:demethyl-4-deoxygadusol synthase